MKRRLLLILCLSLFSLNATVSRAEDESIAAIADVAIVRPVSFVATVIGSAFFVISLPIAAVSHSVHETAEVLVNKPAAFTFTRPIGDFTPGGD